MPNRIFNIYCDESCHLENDHKPYMFIGNISCTIQQAKRHSERIAEIKRRHHFFAEIKWSNMSASYLPFYFDLLDYFFDTDLWFRAIGIKKDSIRPEEKEPIFDEFYYKSYYRLLNYKLDTTCAYNVYMDIKDTWSNNRVVRLQEILNVQYGVFQKVQCIRSEESLLIQLADFILGAISYNANEFNKNNTAKMRILERISSHYQKELRRDENYFFIEMQ